MHDPLWVIDSGMMMENPEDSIGKAMGTFAEAAKQVKSSDRGLYLLAAGLAQLAEGLLATHKKTYRRLAVIEGALQPHH